MSIASEITRLQNIKTNIRSALVTQGVPAASGHDMADFSADILSISTGGGATITVTYSSEFYNKTMTCTKGATTYTETTTSSGSTTFSVAESGTWTITCNGVSRTVEVVLEYTTQMAITQTVTVYGAASDTISFTDNTGAKTVTTNTSGQGSVSISFIPNSTITFTSSIAKNPNNLSQAYSKTITMTDSINTIYVMPDNVIFWYGYGVGANDSYWSLGGTRTGSGTCTKWTVNTNSISCNLGSTFVANKGQTNYVSLDVTSINTLHMIADNDTHTTLNTSSITGIKLLGFSNNYGGSAGIFNIWGLKASWNAWYSATTYAETNIVPREAYSIAINAIYYD